MYLCGKWYELTVKDETYDSDYPVNRLDGPILHNNLLKLVLGIYNPRTDSKINFIGSIRDLNELKRRLDQNKGIALSIYPTTVEDLVTAVD